MNRLLRALLAGMIVAAAGVCPAGEAEDQYAVAAGHFDRRQFELAVTEFREFLRLYPQHSQAAGASYYLATALMQLRQYEDAQGQFEDALTRELEPRQAAVAQFRVGEMSYLLHQHARAAKELTAFGNKHPDHKLNAYALPYLAQLQLKAGRFAEAEQAFRHALTKFPAGPQGDECRLGLAQALQRQGQTREAKNYLTALASKRSPLAEAAQYGLGKLHYAQQDFAAAAKTFEELDSIFPQGAYRARAALGRGCALFRLKQYQAAAAVFQPLTSEKTVGGEAAYWLGLAHKARQDWSAAAEALAAAASEFPDHKRAAEMHFHAGDAWRMAGKHAQAGVQFDQLLHRWPRHRLANEARLGKLRLAAATGDHEQVDELAPRLAEQFTTGTKNHEVRQLLGHSLLRRERHHQAIDVLAPLLKDCAGSPSEPYIALLLAEAYRGGKQFDEAASTLAPVASHGDRRLQGDAHLSQARLLLEQQEHAAAIRPLKAYLETTPGGSQAATCRAELVACYAQLGELSQAGRMFDELLAQHGDSPLAKIAALRLGEALHQAEDFQGAEHVYEALASSPDIDQDTRAKAVSGLAWSQYNAGSLRAAAQNFESLMDAAGDHPLAIEAALTRGRIMEQLGQPLAAGAAYQWVLSREPRPEEYPDALLAKAQVHDRGGQEGQAADAFAQFAKEFPHHARMEAVLYQWAWALHDDRRPAEAESVFTRLRKEHPHSRYWPDATYRLADRALETGRHDEAATLLADLTAANPPRDILAHALYLQGRVAVVAEKWDQVSGPMERLAKEFPGHSLSVLAEFWLGEAAYQMGRHDESAGRFAKLWPRVRGRSDDWVPMAGLRHAQALAAGRHWSKALEAAQDFRGRFPDCDQIYEADYVIGRCLASRAKFDEAREAYRRVVRSPQAGKSETAAMAQWMIGETFFHQKDYEAALRVYLRVEILYDYPRWQAAALLQAGKCYEHLGQRSRAAKLYRRIIQEYGETRFKADAENRMKTTGRPAKEPK